MKANQAFKAEDEAVSPVVGVILMVAITVVLAAVVFVLVNNLGKGTSQKPNISYQQDTTNKAVSVVKADTADWKDIKFSWAAGSDTTTCTAKLNTGTAPQIGATNTPGALATAASPVKANDLITVADPSGTLKVCVLQLSYTPTNESYGSWTFNF